MRDRQRESLVRGLLVGTLLTVLSPPGMATFIEPPRDVPVQRLRENLARIARQRPGDLHNRYVLARVECVAVVQPDAMLEGAGRRGTGTEDTASPPGFLPPQLGGIPAPDAVVLACAASREATRTATLCDEELGRLLGQLGPLGPLDVRWEYGREIRPPVPEAALARLAAAGPSIVYRGRSYLLRAMASGPGSAKAGQWLDRLEGSFRKAMAIRTAVENFTVASAEPGLLPLCLMGRGWCHEVMGRWREAFADYRRAFELRAPPELAAGDRRHIAGVWGGSLGLEAGKRILALRSRAPGGWGPVLIERVEETIAVLARNFGPDGSVTPVLVPLEAGARLDRMLDDSASVAFDLDGRGARHRWTWITPKAAFLVWAPGRINSVTSGRQLFGSFTWCVCWRDGYQPLRLLDDDGNGRLEGPELNGLALWRDRNRDARCQPGEVQSLARYRIRAIRYAARPGPRGKWCPQGVQLENGSWRPTYDWVARPGRSK